MCKSMSTCKATIQIESMHECFASVSFLKLVLKYVLLGRKSLWYIEFVRENITFHSLSRKKGQTFS